MRRHYSAEYSVNCHPLECAAVFRSFNIHSSPVSKMHILSVITGIFLKNGLTYTLK